MTTDSTSLQGVSCEVIIAALELADHQQFVPAELAAMDPASWDDLRTWRKAELVRELASRSIRFGEFDYKEAKDATIASDIDVRRAMAAVFISSRIERPTADRVHLVTENYRDYFGLCGDEPFVEQRRGALGTAFLVAPDLVVTAAHVLREDDLHIVFGFSVDVDGASTIEVPATDVYECENITRGALGELDFAVIQLKGKVTGRTPLKIARAPGIGVGAPVYSLGHPGGLPLKYVDGAAIQTVDEHGMTFVANLDHGPHSSGSPIFDARSHLVEGILLSSDLKDWEDHTCQRCCRITAAYPNSGFGATCLRTHVFAHLVPE
jgi:S1-C subfamily serine protease